MYCNIHLLEIMRVQPSSPLYPIHPLRITPSAAGPQVWQDWETVRHTWKNLIWLLRAGIFKHVTGARNRVGTGLSYWSARLHRLAELMPWNPISGFKNSGSGTIIIDPMSNSAFLGTVHCRNLMRMHGMMGGTNSRGTCSLLPPLLLSRAWS